MRKKNDAGELQIYAVAGTHTIVLSLDMKTKPTDLLGFAFERTDGAGMITWLYGQKCFKSIIPNPVRGQQYPTHLHPVQSFLWKDFTADPGTTYTYKVTPVSGRPQSPVYGTPVVLTITTEANLDNSHGVYFNRGVSGSQSYATQFGNERPDHMTDPVKKQLAYTWLSRGLYEGLIAYIQGAAAGQQLRGDFYEFQYPGVLHELKAARDRGVDVALICSGKPDQKAKNEAAIATAGITDIANHFRNNEVEQPHNKFLVTCDAAGNAL